MATTGAPNQKYADTDKPDLVRGKYSSHTHNFTVTTDGLPKLTENTDNFSDNSQIVCASALIDKPDYFRQAIKMWNYIKGKADTVYAQKSDMVKYNENLGNIIPTRARDGQPYVDIVTHDLKVIVDRYPPAQNDEGEQEISIARIVGTIELSGVHTSEAPGDIGIIDLSFEAFAAGSTYNGASTVSTFIGNTSSFPANQLIISPNTGSITHAYFTFPRTYIPSAGTQTFTYV